VDTGPGQNHWLKLLALFLLFLLAGSAQAQQPVPPLAGRVNDLTATLSADQRQALETKLAAFEAEKGSQMVVLLVPTTEPETIEQFGIRVAEAWKLGRKGVDDGVLLLVAKEDRTLRIEVGYGLEGAIPDAIAKRVIEEVILPRFRDGDFAGGVSAGVDSLIKLVAGEPLPEPKRDPGFDAPSWMDDNFPLVIVVMIAIGGAMRAMLGRLLGASVTGGIAFVGGWWLAGGLVAAAVIAVIVFLLTLAGGGGRGIYRGGGGGGGLGGGGFSGGGGGFGGGGASGRW
jgi:uncharacterized protein